MGKKVTIRDVAQMAGVSVATVSYVLNQKVGQKISDATKKKVLQISNLLGYKNSALVRSLINDRSNNVVLFYHGSDNMLKKSLQLDFFERLAKGLHVIGRDLMIVPDSLKSHESLCDALVCFDTTQEFFHTIGDNNFVPLVGVDLYVNDPLFFQITPSMARAKRVAESLGTSDYDVLYIPFSDPNMNKDVVSAFPLARPLGDVNDLLAYAKNSNRPVLAMGKPIYDIIRTFNGKVALFDPEPDEKVKKICESIDRAVKKEDAGLKSFEI